MANNENLIPIPGRLHSVATEGHVSGADEIYDDTLQKDQATINAEVQTAIGTGGSVDSRIAAAIDALDATATQSAGADGLALSVTETNGKVTAVSGSIAANTYDAYGAASTAKSELIGDAASDYNTLGKLEDKIQENAGDIDDIEGLIPSQATSSNQLADKDFVNSSISTSTATFRGTSATGLTEQQFLTWANSLTKDANDYVFWNTIDSAGNTQFKRYKYNGTQWSYEYTLNNSSFTAAQWASIESGITSELTTKLSGLPTGTEITTAISNEATARVDADTAINNAIGTDSTSGTIKGRIKELEDAADNGAYIGEDDSSTVIASFDPQADTVWKKEQILSSAEKEQIQQNIGIKEWLNTLTGEKFVSVTATDQTSDVTDLLPTTGATNTIYRVGMWDGTSYDEEYYSDYAWDGTDYIQLNKKSIVGEVFDISEYKGGTKYSDLSAALGTNGENVPSSVRKGGMSIKFVSNYDNKYIQARLIANTFTTDITQWQGVDDEPTAGSDNLVKSGGVYDFTKGDCNFINLNLGEEISVISPTPAVWSRVYSPIKVKHGVTYVIKAIDNEASINSVNERGSQQYVENFGNVYSGGVKEITPSVDANYLCFYVKNATLLISIKDNISSEISILDREISILDRKTKNIVSVERDISKSSWGHSYFDLSLVAGKQYFYKNTGSGDVTLGVSDETTGSNITTLGNVSPNSTKEFTLENDKQYLCIYCKITSFVFYSEDSVEYLKNNLLVLDEKQRAKSVIDTSVGRFLAVKDATKDIYLTIVGDSIIAYQSVDVLAAEGVTRVPGVCDLQAVSNAIWEALKFGNVQCRRFDDGKASLVGDYDDRWTDDSQAFFSEVGNFHTQYSKNDTQPSQSEDTVTTHIDNGYFADDFDTDIRKNSPKRFSNESGASVTFTIPAGYAKTDFIFHAHRLGDNITITTNRNSGIVKVNNKPNDWNNSIEANGAVLDTSLANYTESGGGNDTIGIPFMRYHFSIADTSVPTTITITKTSDTTKYLIYYGIEYWGTSDLPFGLHLTNMGIGGTVLSRSYTFRSSIMKYTNPTALLIEMNFNDLTSRTTTDYQSAMTNTLQDIRTYISSLGISQECAALWVPHLGGSGYRNYPDKAKINYNVSELIAKECGYQLLFNMKRVMEACQEIYQKDLTMYEFMMQYKVGGELAIHLNYNGYQYYRGVLDIL